MKKIIILLFFIPFCFISYNVCSQTDTVGVNKNKIGVWYFGMGFGNCNRGIHGDLSFTITSANYLGGSINLLFGMARSKNVPSDYKEGGLRVMTPMDYLDVLAFNFVKQIPIPQRSVRFGFEAGPSWVRWNNAEFDLNPNYDPDWPLPQYKYLKSHVVKNTIGLSLAAKTEFQPLEFFGIGLSVYSVINRIQSVIGLELCLELGRVLPKNIP
jgi:hypothetical protein